MNPKGLAARVGGTMLLAAVAFGWAAAATRTEPPEAPIAPRIAPREDYVSSDACRSCHPSEHASWHRTFHRTMTQAGTASTIKGTDAELPIDGATYTVTRRGEEVWADTTRDGQRRAQRLELATGSHTYQAYCTAGAAPGSLEIFPFVYLLREARWMPRRDAFLQPPDAPSPTLRWASGCIQCHATAGRPGRALDGLAFDSDVAELGVACEACHGPGGPHAARFANPLARYGAYSSMDKGDGAPRADIVNPARLSPERASMVCGQCHAFTYPKDEAEWWRRGSTRVFRPGDDPAQTRDLISAPGDPRSSHPAVEVEADSESLFWPDGAVRVGGREYNGLVASACFQRGSGDKKLSCLSCHSMHASEPAGQIAPARAGDEACFGCHAAKRADVPGHTHHQVGSLGSACAGCHMPKTTYALLKGIASHTIDSPVVRRGPSARPVACNLCHLDRSLSWTDGWLRSWYGSSPSTADPEAANAKEVASGASWLLSGDAAERVIAAAALGSPGALATTRPGWRVRLLARALEDPYAAVRIVANHSLQTVGGYADVWLDLEAPVGDRTRLRAEVITRGRSLDGAAQDGVTEEALDALVARRDDRAISISE